MTPNISRRAALGLLGVGGAAAVLAGCGMGNGGMGSSGATTPRNADIGGAPGDLLVEPNVLRSAGGLLEVSLAARATMLPWGSAERYALTYDGSAVGPTWRVRPGDVVRVELRNDLSRPTNLHTHGLHVSPEGNSDNIYRMADPGSSLTYEYRIPADHPSGTFWYHPHHHGSVAEQVSGGLAGVIIVEDAIDDLPELRAAEEHVLVLSDPRIGATDAVLSATTADKQAGREGDAILINGQLQPTIVGRAGSVQHWRLINASASRYYRLSLDGADLLLIGTDQGRLVAPKRIDDLTLTPGQRAEVLVPLDRPGRVVLVTTEVERGKDMSMGGGMGRMGAGSTGASIGPVTSVLTVDVTGDESAGRAALPASLRKATVTPSDAPAATRNVSFGAMSMGNGEFVIDGHAFSEERITASPSLGTVEEWTVTNNSMMDHPFHLHVWPFQVVHGGDAFAKEGWHDTVNVPTGSSITIRIPFLDFSGRTVFHCHILDHEDLGMMANVEVR